MTKATCPDKANYLGDTSMPEITVIDTPGDVCIVQCSPSLIVMDSLKLALMLFVRHNIDLDL